MQDSKITEKQVSNTRKWLSEALQEYAARGEKSDITLLSNTLDMTEKTIRGYLKGEIGTIETGKIVFAELKRIVIEREKEIKKLVA